MYKPPKGYSFAIGYESKLKKRVHIIAYFQKEEGLKRFCNERNNRSSFDAPYYRVYKFVEGSWTQIS